MRKESKSNPIAFMSRANLALMHNTVFQILWHYVKEDEAHSEERLTQLEQFLSGESKSGTDVKFPEVILHFKLNPSLLKIAQTEIETVRNQYYKTLSFN